MASMVPPVKNVAYRFFWGLVSQANTNLLQVNPTLAAGDVKVSVDGGAFNNITTLPVVTPAGSTAIQVDLSADETNGDNIQIQWIDAAGSEWCSILINLQTVLRKIDDLAFPVVPGNGIDVTATGGVGIDWGNVENQATAVNLSATNIDVDQIVASVSGAVGSVTGNVGGNVVGSVASVTADTAAVADSIAADGSRPSPHQALLMLTRFLFERDVVATTMTVYKENGSTENMTFTLNDASNPTSITRAS